MKKIALTKGQFALVDDEDFEWLNQWKWYYSHGYAARYIGGGRKNAKHARMHRVIMNMPEGMQVDHKNCDRLDNRRLNLRVATHAQNCQNHSKTAPNKTGFIGVYWLGSRNKYQAQIKANKKKYTIGYFDTALEAAKARDKMALKLHGEFARLGVSR